MAIAQKPELLDIRRAAELVERHPETIRRWVWTGKLNAIRQGNRLMVEREALFEAAGQPCKLTLAEWAEMAREVRERGRSEGATVGTNPVIEEREARWKAVDPRARR